MDLDIDLECLHRPPARAVGAAADSAQRVIYPLVPSWQREGSGAPVPAVAVAQDVAGDVIESEPSHAMALNAPPMRSSAAWVPTQSAVLGTWPVPPASNDLPVPGPDAVRARPVTARSSPTGRSPKSTTTSAPLRATPAAPQPAARAKSPLAIPADVSADLPAGSPVAPAPAPEGPAQRRAPLRSIVGAHGQRWLQALPVTLRPVVTARCHPHVIDRLAAAWPEPQAAALCLDDLLFNRRVGRRGFSLAVLGELCELQRALAERRRRR